MKAKPPLTFLLPGDNLSGGVRVTALMGNLLMARGHQVRIALPPRWRQLWADPSLLLARPGWLRSFGGTVATYRDINRLRFAPGEVVIGVGTYMIPDLQRLAAPGVVKVRYHHGFPAKMSSAQRAAWSLPLPTITVSPTLVPELERLSGQRVRAVIPNGIDLSQYFPAPGVTRDAIGTIYAVHPNKAPHEILELLRQAAAAWPATPQVVFSTEPRPAGIPSGLYERSPTIPRIRELYSRALVWLLASHTEGLPGPVLEAMACGAVVISTDNDGSLALIRDGENGLIVPKGDFRAFLDRIQRVQHDPALRARLVAGGLATATRFSWSAAADKMEEFLATLENPALAA
jgi:glycosyltransferase involved in cell wall biosynthesis